MAETSALGPANLIELQRVAGSRPPWLATLVQPEIGGGKADPGEFAALDELEGVSALRVSGLDQSTFETLISRYGNRFTAIHFWKCPRVEDLSPLETLPNLELVAYYWNQRATSLWDFRKTPRLRGLSFNDFTKFDTLDELALTTSLEELEFGNMIDRRSVFETLEPIGRLTNLRRLEFIPRKIIDGRVEPLGSLVNLENLNCPTNLFASRQYAWLHAHLPRARASRVLQPAITFQKPLGGNDVMLVGRGKPMLNSTADKARIEKHERQFELEVAQFIADPGRLPE